MTELRAYQLRVGDVVVTPYPDAPDHDFVVGHVDEHCLTLCPINPDGLISGAKYVWDFTRGVDPMKIVQIREDECEIPL